MTQDTTLPPLPHPAANILIGDDWHDVFTADQLRAYALAALAAADSIPDSGEAVAKPNFISRWTDVIREMPSTYEHPAAPRPTTPAASGVAAEAREQFESAMRADGYDDLDFTIAEGSDRYFYHETGLAFAAWNAALATTQPEPSSTTSAAEEDDGLTREQWFKLAACVYLGAGDDEATARDCAGHLVDQQDWLGDDIEDPAEAALADIAGRPASGEDAQAVEPVAMYDVFKLYADLWDIWREANAVDTPIGRPAVLLTKLGNVLKTVGTARNCEIPIGAPTPTQEGGQAMPSGWRLIAGEAYGQRYVSLSTDAGRVIVNAYEQGSPEMFEFLSAMNTTKGADHG